MPNGDARVKLQPAPFAAFVDALDAARRDPRELSYDPDLVRHLTPDLRSQGEAEILRRVREGDERAFETAGALGLFDAVPALEGHRIRGSAFFRAAAERALFALRGDALPAGTREDPILRGLDAYALKTSDRPEAIPAMLALLADPGVHARVHASEGLVEKLGLSALAAPRGSPLRTMLLGECSRLSSVWPDAAAALLSIFEAIRGGKSAESLDLVYRPSPDPEALTRFWTQATKWQSFDVSNIESMGEHDRAFAEMVLVSRLQSGDINVLPALRALRVRGWASHLAAALPWVERHPDVLVVYQDVLAKYV